MLQAHGVVVVVVAAVVAVVVVVVGGVGGDVGGGSLVLQTQQPRPAAGPLTLAAHRVSALLQPDYP